MTSECVNNHIYQGLYTKHLANRRRRTDDEKAGWKVKAAARKTQQAAARDESQSESEAESVENGRSKKGKRVAKPARVPPLNRPDTESRASDLLKDVLRRGGGGLVDFLETASWSLFIWSDPTKLNPAFVAQKSIETLTLSGSHGELLDEAFERLEERSEELSEWKYED